MLKRSLLIYLSMRVRSAGRLNGVRICEWSNRKVVNLFRIKVAYLVVKTMTHLIQCLSLNLDERVVNQTGLNPCVCSILNFVHYIKLSIDDRCLINSVIKSRHLGNETFSGEMQDY